MPPKQIHKKTIDEKLGLKQRSDFSENDLEFYDRDWEISNGPDWKAEVAAKKQNNANEIETLDKLIDEYKAEANAKRAQYKNDKLKSIDDSLSALDEEMSSISKEVDSVKESITKNNNAREEKSKEIEKLKIISKEERESTLAEQKRKDEKMLAQERNILADRTNMGFTIESIDSLMEYLEKNDSGYHSVSDLAVVDLSGLEKGITDKEEHAKLLGDYKAKKKEELTALKEQFIKEREDMLQKANTIAKERKKAAENANIENAKLITPEEKEKQLEVFNKKAAELEKRLDELNDKGFKKLEKQKNIIQLKSYVQSNDSGVMTCGGIKVNLDTLEDAKYEKALQNRSKREAWQNDIDKYAEMRSALGRNAFDIKPERIQAALNEYNLAKTTFENHNGWQQFWGKILPASWYKPAADYEKMNDYRETLQGYGIDTNVPAVIQQENTDAIVPWSENESNQLQTETNLDRQAVVDNEKIVNVPQTNMENKMEK